VEEPAEGAGELAEAVAEAEVPVAVAEADEPVPDEGAAPAVARWLPQPAASRDSPITPIAVQAPAVADLPRTAGGCPNTVIASSAEESVESRSFLCVD
jgi:hypothetical protein